MFFIPSYVILLLHSFIHVLCSGVPNLCVAVTAPLINLASFSHGVAEVDSSTFRLNIIIKERTVPRIPR